MRGVFFLCGFSLTRLVVLEELCFFLVFQSDQNGGSSWKMENDAQV